jgi:hypothetical protein
VGGDLELQEDRFEEVTNLAASSVATCLLTSALQHGPSSSEFQRHASLPRKYPVCSRASRHKAFTTTLPGSSLPNSPIPTPLTYTQAVTGPHASFWQGGIDAELQAFERTGTYKEVQRPTDGTNVVKGMWLFRTKPQGPGVPPQFKARYVAKGYSQKEGVDYFHTYVPSAKLVTFRTLLHIATVQDMFILRWRSLS